MSDNWTSIGLKQSTKARLEAHFKPRENWDDLLCRLLDALEKITPKVKVQ